jgi:hypothetical protein
MGWLEGSGREAWWCSRSRRTAGFLAGARVFLLLTGCPGTPQLGRGGSTAQGAAGPEGASSNATVQLARCDRPIGAALELSFPIIANIVEGVSWRNSSSAPWRLRHRS